MASVKSRFAVVTEKEIFQMQDIIIPNNKKKALKWGIKIYK